MSIDLDAYREQSLATWGQMAPGWAERREWLRDITRPVSAWLLEAVEPRSGQTLLELAGGTGDLAVALAERVGDEGRLIASDFSGEMLEFARQAGTARGLTNIEYRVLDAERIDLPHASVDGVVCRFGYMLMADPAAALRETRRVLREGGTLTFTVWMGPERNPWAALPPLTLLERGHLPLPEPGTPGIFALADPARIRELVTQAGFGEPELEKIAFEFRYADGDELWDSIVRLAGGLARAINALQLDERQATRAAIEQRLAPYRQNDGSYRPPAAAWGVRAR